MILVRETISDSLNMIFAFAFSSVEMESDMLKSKHFFGEVFLIQMSPMEKLLSQHLLQHVRVILWMSSQQAFELIDRFLTRASSGLYERTMVVRSTGWDFAHSQLI